MSETGRLPMFFSIIFTIIKYLYRLKNCEHSLLWEAYQLNKSLHNNNVQSWYSAASFIIKSLNININHIKNYTETVLINIAKSRLRKQFEKCWDDERDILSPGKLTTYFKVKKTFNMEKYLMFDDFKLRRTLCRFRISAHDLRIEPGRYSKNPTDRADRICTWCNINEVEDEFHLLLRCKLFKDEREILFNKVTLINKNFDSLNLIDKVHG